MRKGILVTLILVEIPSLLLQIDVFWSAHRTYYHNHSYLKRHLFVGFWGVYPGRWRAFVIRPNSHEKLQ